MAQEVIDAKLAAESLAEMRNMIDLRFGYKHLQEYFRSQRKKVREQKEQSRGKKNQRQKQKEMEDTIKNGLIVFAVLGCAVGLLYSCLLY